MTLKIEPKLRQARNALKRLFDKSFNTHAIAFLGRGGQGKTTFVTKFLKDAGIEFVHLKGRITAIEFYKTLYHNIDGVFFIDDADDFAQDTTLLNLMKAATDDKKIRVLSYRSGALNKGRGEDGTEFEPSFTFLGKIIIASNIDLQSIKNANKGLAVHMRAMMDRGTVHKFDFTFSELADLIKGEIVPLPCLGTTVEQREFVLKKLIWWGASNPDQFSLRSWGKAIAAFVSDPDTFDEFLHTTLFTTDSDEAIFFRLAISDDPVEIQIKNFVEETGLSRPTFFRWKKQYKPLLKDLKETLDELLSP